MGLKREKIIGRKSSILGHFPEEQRHLFVDAIEKQGFAKGIPLELKVNEQEVLHILFDVFPIKIGKDKFFLSAANEISNHRPNIKKFEDDKFIQLSVKDTKFVKAELKHYKLTSRQQEIALLSLKGYSNLEIAETLYLSPHTVKDHLKEIFLIIGVHSRSELFPKLLNLR
jgi:DNA-binding CsgD family transcriptional regulator